MLEEGSDGVPYLVCFAQGTYNVQSGRDELRQIVIRQQPPSSDILRTPHQHHSISLVTWLSYLFRFSLSHSSLLHVSTLLIVITYPSSTYALRGYIHTVLRY